MSHLITFSALIITTGGIARPRALAVLSLIISSNLVGCSTGRSAGLAPLVVVQEVFSLVHRITRQEFQRGQLTELANTGFEAWGKRASRLRQRLLTVTVGGLGHREVAIRTARWSQRLPCFLRYTLLVRAGLLIGGWFWRDIVRGTASMGNAKRRCPDLTTLNLFA